MSNKELRHPLFVVMCHGRIQRSVPCTIVDCCTRVFGSPYLTHLVRFCINAIHLLQDLLKLEHEGLDRLHAISLRKCFHPYRSRLAHMS